MVSLDRCRRLLGDKANHLSDEEVEELRDRLAALADVTLEQAIKDLYPSNHSFHNVL